MKDNSLQPLFIPTTDATDLHLDFTHPDINITGLRHAVEHMPFNTVYDILRAAAHSLVTQDRTQEAIDYIRLFDTSVARHGDEKGKLLDIHAALMQILTSLYVIADMHQDALLTAATALNLLAQESKRKDEAFLTILATLLYDISLVHNARSEHKQAEREIEKSMKLFERLAKVNPARYGAAHMLALNASTSVYQSRIKQANTLAHYQVATSTYLQMMNEGIEGAGMQLIESLTTEGHTLMKMSRQREAIQYFTRALKYLTKINPEFSLHHLQLSIDLGEALLTQKGTRDKGIHLLNTMLYKAGRLNAEEMHRRIVDILIAARNPSLDIFSFWHKLFPRS